jgi:hypothetical protein
MRDNDRKVVEFRTPAERRADTADLGDDGGGITRTTWLVTHRKVHARSALHALDYLEHGIASATTYIEGKSFASST